LEKLRARVCKAVSLSKPSLNEQNPLSLILRQLFDHKNWNFAWKTYKPKSMEAALRQIRFFRLSPIVFNPSLLIPRQLKYFNKKLEKDL